MRKRLFGLVLVLALVIPFAAVADETYYQSGNLVPSIGVGLAGGYGFTVSVYPGLELIVAKIRIADVIPLDFGVAAKGLFGFSSSYFGTSYTHIGLGVFGTVHWGLRGMNWDLDFLDPVDLWWGIGLAISAHVPAASWPGGPLDFATVGGVNYFLNDRFALMFAGSYWGYGGGYVGILYKLGKGEKLIKKEG